MSTRRAVARSWPEESSRRRGQGCPRAARAESARRARSRLVAAEKVPHRDGTSARNILRRNNRTARRQLAKRVFVFRRQEHVAQPLNSPGARMNAADVDRVDATLIDKSAHRRDVTGEE